MNAYTFVTTNFMFLKHPNLNTVIDITAAYCDLREEIKGESRNLRFLSRHPLSQELALETVVRCIRSYNDFCPQAMVEVIKIFGDAKYYFAREASVALYIIPDKGLNLDNLTERIKATLCDEFSYVHFFGNGAFRLWWD